MKPPGGVWAGTWHFPALHPVPFGKIQPRVSWSGLHSAALSSVTGLKTHSPHRLLPEEHSSPP